MERKKASVQKFASRKVERKKASAQKLASSQLSVVHEKLNIFRCTLRATTRTAKFCLKDLALTLIEARQRRVDIEQHLGSVQGADLDRLDRLQREVADDAASLEAVTENLLLVLGEFRGYGYVPGGEAARDRMLVKLHAVLKTCDGVGVTSTGETSGQEVFYLDPYPGSQAAAPAVTQDVHTGSGA
jgi:hypothetical protein